MSANSGDEGAVTDRFLEPGKQTQAFDGALTGQRYDEVIEALKEVVDPELGINIVDLGLIYGVAEDLSDGTLIVHITLTSAGCPLTDVIEEQIAYAVQPVCTSHRLNWVWMPPWGPERITDDGREMMRALGFNI